MQLLCILHLHSTMYLLIPAFQSSESTNLDSFTFHYVSINSLMPMPLKRIVQNLHSTMYLLIQVHVVHEDYIPEFTFHYVSINSNPQTIHQFL